MLILLLRSQCTCLVGLQRMQADEPGFLPGKTRNKDEVGLKNVAFYYDDVHPDGRTGARCV